MNNDGTGKKQLPENQGAMFPTITYDGQKIALLKGSTVTVLNSEGTDLKTLNDPKLISGDVPKISGDGSKVIFIGYVNSSYELFVCNSDGYRSNTNNGWHWQRQWMWSRCKRRWKHDSVQKWGDGNRMVVYF